MTRTAHRQKLGEALNHTENQILNPCHGLCCFLAVKNSNDAQNEAQNDYDGRYSELCAVVNIGCARHQHESNDKNHQ